jgi:DNA polymerase-3 subunit alpha
MALIFDTETTGLPITKSYGVFPDYTELNFYNSSRIVQISYIITDYELNKLEESDTIIKADTFKIKNSSFHGITDLISQTKGTPFVEFAEDLYHSLDHVDVLIAHNIDFDINILLSELFRYGLYECIKKIQSKKHICTMKNTKFLVNATFKMCDGIKDPNLKELYHFATGEEMENHHNSMQDTLHLYRAIKILYLNGTFKVSWH